MPVLLHRATRLLALVGGMALLAVVATTVASIVGRALIPLGFRPVPGDFELVEHGIAFAAFSFLPWCQASRGHVTVDLLDGWVPRRASIALVALFDLALSAVAAFMVWRLWAGLADRMRYGDTTFILELPVSWGYAAALPGLVLFAVVAFAMAGQGARSVVAR